MAMRLNVSVGTMVTFPHRNPMELAQRFSGIAGLIREGKEVSAGMREAQRELGIYCRGGYQCQPPGR